MLRSFRVENHKSIRDEQELSFLPVYDKSRPVVPVAAIFGANASGKSNLLDALRWMRDAVLSSYAAWQPGSGVPRTPFLLDPETASRPSGYCLEIVIDDVRYMYGFEVDDEKVRKEWLYTYPRNRRRTIFERDETGIRLGSTVPGHRERAELLGRQTRDNALLLTVAAQNNLAETQPVYQWFRRDVHISGTDPVGQDELLRRLQNETDRMSIVSLIRAADLGIRDIAVQDGKEQMMIEQRLKRSAAQHRDLVEYAYSRAGNIDEFNDSLQAAERSLREIERLTADLYVARLSPSRLVFHHGDAPVVLTLDDQSAGTRSWITLVSRALAPLDRGGLLVVDEVDASLHPHITEHLVRLFVDGATNPHGAQLIFTSHDATLLDDYILARDQVWFVDKHVDSGATDLFALADFHPRKNENTEGRYLAGAYGAIPVLTDLDFRDAVTRRWKRDEAA